MEITIDLQRILWHELGHFCVNILDTEINSNFSIESFRVSYYKIAISNHKWGGAVKVIPSIKFEALIEDVDKTSFAFLNLISGCIFQTIFLKEILQTQDTFENCFSLQPDCAGQIDCLSFNTIASRLRYKYGRNDEFIQFSEAELISIYYKLVVENKKFIERIDEVVNQYKDKIFNSYDQFENQEEFHYELKDDELNSFKNIIHKLMSETSFDEILINLKEQIKVKLLANSNLK